MSARERFLVDLVQRAMLERGAIVFAPGDLTLALAGRPVPLRPTEPVR
jgi:hypothetical protein